MRWSLYSTADSNTLNHRDWGTQLVQLRLIVIIVATTILTASGVSLLLTEQLVSPHSEIQWEAIWIPPPNKRPWSVVTQIWLCECFEKWLIIVANCKKVCLKARFLQDTLWSSPTLVLNGSVSQRLASVEPHHYSSTRQCPWSWSRWCKVLSWRARLCKWRRNFLPLPWRPPGMPVACFSVVALMMMKKLSTLNWLGRVATNERVPSKGSRTEPAAS